MRLKIKLNFFVVFRLSMKLEANTFFKSSIPGVTGIGLV